MIVHKVFYLVLVGIMSSTKNESGTKTHKQTKTDFRSCERIELKKSCIPVKCITIYPLGYLMKYVIISSIYSTCNIGVDTAVVTRFIVFSVV